MQITINDKAYSLQWGMGAIEIYCDSMNCDIEGLDKVFILNKDQPKAIVSLILAALKNAAELKDETLDVSYRQLQAWLDEADQEIFKEIMKDFKASKYFGRTIAEYLLGEPSEESAIKKKSRLVKS